MIKGLEAVLIGSESAKALADFYKEKVGLKFNEELEMGESGQKAYDFSLQEGVGLYILDHSEVKGKSKDPSRVMFNLEVGDIEEETKRMKETDVKVVQDVYHIEGYGLIATFEDLDGNYFQFVQIRPTQ